MHRRAADQDAEQNADWARRVRGGLGHTYDPHMQSEIRSLAGNTPGLLRYCSYRSPFAQGIPTASAFPICRRVSFGPVRITVIKVSELQDAKLDWAEPFVISSAVEMAALKGTKLMSMLEYNLKPFMKDKKLDASKGGLGRSQSMPKNELMRTDMRQVVE